jgi:thiol oxidase
MKEEASVGTGDPKFPKIIWPPKQLCSSCHLSSNQRENGVGQIDWNLNEVYKFLTVYYGKTLASLYKEKDRLGDEVTDGAIADLVASKNAVVVPVGAALAIALASCAFGALACYWRSQQKNRKYYHQLHSLKNI